MAVFVPNDPLEIRHNGAGDATILHPVYVQRAISMPIIMPA